MSPESNNSLQAIAGIHIRTGRFVKHPSSGWYESGFTRPELSSTSASDKQGVTVYINGYITAVEGEGHSAEYAAERVLRLYRRFGLELLTRLRGSYTGLIVDERSESLYLFNDRRASRPLYVRQVEDGSLHFHPEIRLMAAEYAAQPSLDEQAVIQFLVFGSFLGNHTLFSDIRKVPQASIVTIRRDGMRMDRYWSLGYNPDESASEDELIEECDSLITQAVSRVVHACPEPVLFLSGGTDSRVLLGTLMRINADVPVACFGSRRGDDFAIARQLARHCELELHEFALPDDSPERNFARASRAADCRAETIDTPALDLFNEHLAQRFGTFINGAESFGWHGLVADNDQAVSAIGVFHLDQVARLNDWLPPRKAAWHAKLLDRTINHMVAGTGEVYPNRIKDSLYYQQRLGNMLNAFAIPHLRRCENARPLVDEDVMDFVCRLPDAWRDDKKLLRLLLSRQYPALQAIPFATRDSIPVPDDYARLFAKDPDAATCLTENLVEHLNTGLVEILDRGRLEKFIQAVVRGDDFPPVRRAWWASIPGLWRIVKSPVENRVHPVTLLLRVLQLQLYLKGINSV